MDKIVEPSPVARHFIDTLSRSRRADQPFPHWFLDNALPERIIDGIAALPFAPPTGTVFDGRRETNNSTRVYFTPENQAKFQVCRELADALRSSAVLSKIESTVGRDVGVGHLRIEYCQDIDGFWLEPHLDISVKLYTMLIYLSDDPALRDAGTDIYDASPEHKPVGRAPYEKNKGLIFLPGKDTWHGVSKRTIKGLRKSIIVNWVTSDWRDKWELC